MKKVKLLVWMLIVAFAAVVIYQNKVFFWETKQSLAVDLAFANYRTPEIELLVIFGGFFAAGLLLGIYFLIGRGLKNKKKIKALKAQVKAEADKAVVLEEELRALRGEPVLPETAAQTHPALQAAGANPGAAKKA